MCIDYLSYGVKEYYLNGLETQLCFKQFPSFNSNKTGANITTLSRMLAVDGIAYCRHTKDRRSRCSTGVSNQFYR